MKTNTFTLVSLFLSLALLSPAFAEYDELSDSDLVTESNQGTQSYSTGSKKRSKKVIRKYKSKKIRSGASNYSDESQRKYFVEDQQRVDAGVFHVGVAAGGNFWVEPKVNSTTNLATGEFFKDFGFQLGVIFDYDYTDTNLSLRGKFGYKYILSSIHQFHFDFIGRLRIPFSERVQFTFGPGVSGAVWFRKITNESPQEQVVFLPSLVIHTGFDFNPFMVEFNWLINRFGEDTTITGAELSFGVRL